MRQSSAWSINHRRLLALALGLFIVGVGIWMAAEIASGHGSCSSHHMYRVYDGTHDRDGDGVGCETLPEPPGGPPTEAAVSSVSTSDSYDRDNWNFNSSSARAELKCDSTEHVDHVVALKEAYDSGGANWTNARKQQFANDRDNLWCLEASVNISKSDHNLAEWSGGSCEQRQYIAVVTVDVKESYSLLIDDAEQVAIDLAKAAECSASPSIQSPTQTPPGDPGGTNNVDAPAPDFPAGRIMARRLEDGRVEFAYRPEGEETILPRGRFFPTSARVDRWLNSTPLQVEGIEIGRISARLQEDGRIEFSFIVADGQRILPRQRLFPASSSEKWLRSTVIDADG